MTSCAFCGRENDSESKFCIDCGKPVHPSTARVGPAYPSSASSGVPGASAQPHATPAISHAPVAAPAEPMFGRLSPPRPAHGAGCAHCGAPYTAGVDLFCSRCGTRVGQRVSTGMPQRAPSPTIALLSDSGEVLEVYTLDFGEALIGRGDADIRFEHDHFMSPLHARIEQRDGVCLLRDLGSRNGSWLFIDQPTRLTDGDQLLIGSQVIRFRRLGYPGPHPPEADSTRRMGSSVPTVDIAALEQLRADGSVRDVLHLSPGRSVTLGRESGDWLFPYDATMSGRHAEIRSEDSEFYVHDARSRNGVAITVRGERELAAGQRLLMGDQILRVERV